MAAQMIGIHTCSYFSGGACGRPSITESRVAHYGSDSSGSSPLMEPRFLHNSRTRIMPKKSASKSRARTCGCCHSSSDCESDVPSPSIPESCEDGPDASLSLPDVNRSSWRSCSSKAPSGKESIIARIGVEDEEFLHAQQKSYVSVDMLSLSSSYDADVETVSSEKSFAKNSSSGMDKEESGLLGEGLRSVAWTFAIGIIGWGLMALAIAVDPQLTAVLALITYLMAYYICIVVMVLMMVNVCAYTVRAVMRTPSKSSGLGLFVLSVTFIALQFIAIVILTKIFEENKPR